MKKVVQDNWPVSELITQSLQMGRKCCESGQLVGLEESVVKLPIGRLGV